MRLFAVLVVLVLAACSNTVDPASLGADGRRLVDVARSADSVYAALNEAAQAGDPNGEAFAKARSLLEVFSSDVAALPAQEASVAEAATFFVDAGSIMLGFVQNNDGSRAQSFFRDRVTDNHDRLATAVDDRLGAMGGAPVGGEGSSMPVGLAVGALLVVAVAIWMFRQSQSAVAAPEAEIKPAPKPEHDTEPVAAVAADVEPAAREPAPVRQPAAEPMRSRLQPTDLRDVLEAAVSRVRESGWEITFDSPDVKVLADPLRLRRLVGTLLLSATLHDPNHIGVVAAVENERVILSVGDDGASDSDGNPLPRNAGPDDPPNEVGNQLSVARRLAEGMEAEVSWVRHEGISLYTVDIAVAN